MQLGWTTFTGNLAMSALMALMLGMASFVPAVRYRPRLRYSLWLLVLVKFLPLPSLLIPMGPAVAPESELGGGAVSATDIPMSDPIAVDETQPFAGTGSAGSETTSHTTTTGVSRPRGRTEWWGILLWVTMGVTGVLIWKSLSQMRQVSRLIDGAAPADERIARLSADSARMMNLEVVPDVRVVEARVAPLLWSNCELPTIVLPVQLIERLDDDEIRCIMCHEIAHHLRRDPWVNLFAFLAASAYWWNPIAWWARREVLSAQEECCDAVVISRPGLGRRKYAHALFETIEFLNDDRSLSPVLASGFGSNSLVRRRFDMIAGSKLKRRMLGLVVPLVMALVFAFVSSPVRGQAGKDEAPDAGREAGQPTEGEYGYGVDVGGDGGLIGDPHQLKGATDIEFFFAASAANRSKAAPAERRTSLQFGGEAKVKVDPKKHCLYIGIPPYEGCENGTLRIDLEKGVTYTVRCSGEAFMSTETGENADPYAGIVFAYETDEQDCHEIRNMIMKPGDTITFTTPTCLGADEDVFAVAFFLQAWKHAYWPAQRGSYTLTFTRSVDD